MRMVACEDPLFCCLPCATWIWQDFWIPAWQEMRALPQTHHGSRECFGPEFFHHLVLRIHLTVNQLMYYGNVGVWGRSTFWPLAPTMIPVSLCLFFELVTCSCLSSLFASLSLSLIWTFVHTSCYPPSVSAHSHTDPSHVPSSHPLSSGGPTLSLLWWSL